MKLIIIIFGVLLFASSSIAQDQIKSDDFGRITLNAYLPDQLIIPSEAKNQLKNKLLQIVSNNGYGGSSANPRFIITADVNIGTKNIIAGPPQMVSQNVTITLFIGDAFSNQIFSNTTFSSKGVGSNENTSFIDAFKNINPKSKDVIQFLDEGKNKILSYYKVQCDFIIKDALSLKKQEKYDEAIYKLSLVPDACSECYSQCINTLADIYQAKIDRECVINLNQAKAVWSAESNGNGALKAGDYLFQISPSSSCKSSVDAFIKSIDDKLKADEKSRWEFKMKQYNDKVALQNKAIDAYRAVATEFAKNQPKTITHQPIYWRY